MIKDEIAATIQTALDRVEAVTNEVTRDLNGAIVTIAALREMIVVLVDLMQPLASELDRIDQIVKQGYVKLEDPDVAR